MTEDNSDTIIGGMLFIMAVCVLIWWTLAALATDRFIILLIVGILLIFPSSFIILKLSSYYNSITNSNIGNPLIALFVTLFIGFWIPQALDTLDISQEVLPILPNNIRTEEFFPAFRLFGFSYTAAYVIEQLAILFIFDNFSSWKKVSAFTIGFIAALFVFYSQVRLGEDAATALSVAIAAFYFIVILRLDD